MSPRYCFTLALVIWAIAAAVYFFPEPTMFEVQVDINGKPGVIRHFAR